MEINESEKNIIETMIQNIKNMKFKTLGEKYIEYRENKKFKEKFFSEDIPGKWVSLNGKNALKEMGKNREILKSILYDYAETGIYVNRDFFIFFAENFPDLLHEYFFYFGMKNKRFMESVLEILEKSETGKFMKLWYKIYNYLKEREKEIDKYLMDIDMLELTYALNRFGYELFMETGVGIQEKYDAVISAVLNRKIGIDKKEYSYSEEDIMSLEGKHFEKKGLINSREFLEMTWYFKLLTDFIRMEKSIMYMGMVYKVTDPEKIEIFPGPNGDLIECYNGRIRELKYFKMYMEDVMGMDEEKYREIAGGFNENEVNIKIASHMYKKIYGSKIAGVPPEIFFRFVKKVIHMQDMKLQNSDPGIYGSGLTYHLKKSDLYSIIYSDLSSDMKDCAENIIKNFDELTTDLNDRKGKVDIFTRPFIRIGEIYLWGYFSVKYKNIFKIYNNAVFMKEYKSNTEFAEYFENSVKETFEKYGVPAIKNCTPGIDEKNYKDIDVLAYDGNNLYVVECKLTCDRLSAVDVTGYGRFMLERAKVQLKDRKKHIKKYLTPEVKEILGIKDNKFEVIPLIITNSFEYAFDQKKGIRKLSICELEYYLKNNLLGSVKKSYRSVFDCETGDMCFPEPVQRIYGDVVVSEVI